MNGHLYDIFLIRINTQNPLRIGNGHRAEQQGYRQHKDHGKAKGLVDSLFVPCAPVLREKQQGASCKTEVAGKKQR